MRAGRCWTMLALAGLLVACAGGDDGEMAGVVGDPTEVSYAPELDVSLERMTRTESGLYTHDLAAGEGEPARAGDRVTVHYTGWLANGDKFDSSRDLGQPFTFTLGTGEVIDGWDQGVEGMRVGGRRTLVVPPGLGYGERGAGGVIPGGATLIFDVELLAVGG